MRELIVRVHSRAGIHAVATARRLPEQVDRAGSIALVIESRKLEEGRLFHTKSVKQTESFLHNKPIVIKGPQNPQIHLLFVTNVNTRARKGAVSATWLSAKSTCSRSTMSLAVLATYP